jgi:hypothetical protein
MHYLFTNIISNDHYKIFPERLLEEEELLATDHFWKRMHGVSHNLQSELYV